MDLQRTCPECNLAFEAPSPDTGPLTCPLCDAQFLASPAAPLPSQPPAAPPAPSTSGRQILMGGVAVGALVFLVGGLVHAYHLFQTAPRKLADSPPTAQAPPPALPSPPPLAFDPPPVQPPK